MAKKRTVIATFEDLVVQMIKGTPSFLFTFSGGNVLEITLKQEGNFKYCCRILNQVGYKEPIVSGESLAEFANSDMKRHLDIGEKFNLELQYDDYESSEVVKWVSPASQTVEDALKNLKF